MWVVAGLGIVSAFVTLIIGFFPPAQFPTGNVTFYVGFLILGMILFCAAPSIILKFKKPSWTVRLAHEKDDE